MAVIRRDTSKLRTRFSRGGKLQGGGTNHAVKLVGGRGRRVSIPRSADSFKSTTDNT
jgi:hypothetical protein